jgi:threonine dehydratase
MVHPFDDWSVIHGQGTIALEILEDAPDAQCIVVPIGGGGLLSGVALAAKGLAPGVRIVGVEPAVADDARQTLLEGRLVRLSSAPQTIADGVRTLEIGHRAYETMVDYCLVDEIVTVDEGEIILGLRYASNNLGLAIEPTAALPVAAWLAGKLHWDGSGPIVMVLTGGNFEEDRVEDLISGQGRDRPARS